MLHSFGYDIVLITFLIKKLLQNCRLVQNISSFLKFFFEIFYENVFSCVWNIDFVFRFSVAFWTEISAETENLNLTETETETHTETEISAETETESEKFRSLIKTVLVL